MVRALFGVFVILHGLVHLWPVVLSQELVVYRPEMGWTGESWLLTSLIGDRATRLLAGVAYAIGALVFCAGAVGLLVGAGWWRPVVVGSAALSAAVIVVFWDGRGGLLVEKGLIGLLIDLAILVPILVFQWPAVR